MRKSIIYLFAFMMLGTVYSQSGNYCVVYSADENGNEVSGSLDSLLMLVNQGNSVRVGWEIPLNVRDGDPLIVKHWADAGFLTILNGHLFGQVRGIFEQAPAPMSPPMVMIVKNNPNSWVGIIGTTGLLRNNYTGPEDKSLMDQMKLTEKRVKTYWSVQSRACNN